jgi:hypothetical protein
MLLLCNGGNLEGKNVVRHAVRGQNYKVSILDFEGSADGFGRVVSAVLVLSKLEGKVEAVQLVDRLKD